MNVPGLGPVDYDDDLGWHRSGPVTVPMFGDATCHFVLEGYADDESPEDFHQAIRTFLALDRSALEAAVPEIFAYYRDVMDGVTEDDDWYVAIDGPGDVLDHITPGGEPTVSRDTYSDRHVYVSVECGCTWETEHGLQLVFRDGAVVSKVGPYDGHLTNTAAYADPTLDGVVYRSP